MEPAIHLHDLTLGYARHPAVHHVSGTFEQGSLTAIVGPNGAGKTTLMKGLVGALRPLSGRVAHADGGAPDIAYLPQQTQMDPSFPISVLDAACLGYWRRTGMFGRVDRVLRDRALETLAGVGLNGFEERPVGTLSRGQFQRLLFARMALQDAPVILMDEPLTAVDERSADDLLALLDRWHGEGRTIIAVLHDLALVRDRFPETLLLAREVVGWGTTAEVLSDANLGRARAMAEAWDEAAPVCERDDAA